MTYNFKVCLAVLLVWTLSMPVFASENRKGASVVGPVTNSAYSKECGACHFAFQPQLLPRRSWERLMGSLDQHFGDSASVDSSINNEILTYLVSNSAETSSAKVPARILAALDTSETPLRITDTLYFKRKHREVQAAVFKRKSIGTPSNCAGCHLTANNGDFDEHKVKIPKN